MEVYRLSKLKYAKSKSGIGAAIEGGRWNSKGTEVLYVSIHPALALLELLRRQTAKQIPSSTCIVQYSIPDKYLSTNIVSVKALPEGWDEPHHITETKKIGDDFVRSEDSVIMAVPSVIIPSQRNFIINTNHKDLEHIKIVDIMEKGINFNLLFDPAVKL